MAHGTQPDIELLEEDNYWRQLFLYHETNMPVNSDTLIISQKVDDGYVYFNPYDNFFGLPEDITSLNMEEMVALRHTLMIQLET